MKSIKIFFMVTVEKSTNPTVLLQNLVNRLKSGDLPSSMGNVKGFMRHVTDAKVVDNKAVFTADVEYAKARPTIYNLGRVTAAAMGSVLMGSLFTEPNSIDFGAGFLITDPSTGRAAAYTISQPATDVSLQTDGGFPQVTAPVIRAGFSEMVSVHEPLSLDSIRLEVWRGSGQALLEQIWTFLESNQSQAN